MQEFNVSMPEENFIVYKYRLKIKESNLFINIRGNSCLCRAAYVLKVQQECTLVITKHKLSNSILISAVLWLLDCTPCKAYQHVSPCERQVNILLDIGLTFI